MNKVRIKVRFQPPFFANCINAYCQSRGWVTFPLVLLLIALLGLSQMTYKTLKEEREWQAQQVSAFAQQDEWNRFIEKRVMNLDTDMAERGDCLGICPLMTPKDWPYEDFLSDMSIRWALDMWERDSERFYRLCALAEGDINHRCWWFGGNSDDVIISSMRLS